MTVELRTLRVSAELDASKYTAGASQVVGADKAMSAAHAGAAEAATQLETRISQAGNVLSRLSRQYVDGYAGAQKMASAVNQLSRGIETGKIQMTQAGAILDGIARKYGAITGAELFAARGQVEFAQAISATNARLSAQVVAANQAAASAGRISANQNQGGLARFGSLNATSQFQDIAITSAMGQSPLTIALQQGTQLGMALEQQLGDQGVKGVVKSLGSAFMGLLTPVNLLAIGLTGIVAVAIQFGGKLLPQVKSLDEALKDQLKSVLDLADAYGQAGVKAEDFGRKSVIAAESAARRDTEALRKAADAANKAAMGQLTTFITPGRSAGGYYGPTSPEYAAFNEAIQKLNAGIKAGHPDFDAFEKDISAVVASGAGLQTTADKIFGIEKAAADANAQLEKTDRIIKDINRSSVGGPGSIDRLREQGQAQTELMRRMHPEKFADPRNQIQEEIDTRRRNESAWADVQRMTAKSPQEIYAAVKRQEEAKVISGESDIERADRIRIESTKALAQAEYQLIEAHKQRTRALDDTIASSRLDLELIGKTTGEQAALRMEFEKTQELRQQAAENGIKVDQQELDLIHQKAVEYGKLADAIQKTNLLRDIAFERDQLFRSPGEQQIASRLRGTGMGLDSEAADAMRWNQNFAELKDGVRGFFDDFEEGLLNGDDIGEALGKAILNGLNKVLDRMLDQVLNQLANSITSAIMGSGAGGVSGGGAVAAFGTAGGLMEMLQTAGGFGKVPDNVGAGPAAAVVSGGGGGSIADYIRQAATREGIDPNIAIRVARSEGGLKDPFRQGESMLSYGREESYGPFQLHMRNGGVGTRALAAGIDPRTDWKGGVDFAMKEASQKGWGQWFGAAKAGIGNREGIGVSAKLDQNMTKLSDTTAMATKDIGSLGKVGADATQGLGQMTNALAQFPAAPASFGGGAFGAGGGGLASLFGGGSGPSFSPWEMSYFTSHAGLWAKGGAFLGGNVIPFARGGVVDRPTLFPMANGAGLMGEAGPEAVMPLRRGANGSLGVAMHGGGARVTVNVINNGAPVSVEKRETTDADGSMNVEVMLNTVESRIAKRASQPGTPMDKVLSARNARAALKRYG